VGTSRDSVPRVFRPPSALGRRRDRRPGLSAVGSVVAASPLALIPVAVLVSAVGPAPARAWVEARVHRAEARLSLPESPASPMRLEIELEVDVVRGWLQRLDLAGLPEGLTVVSGEAFPAGGAAARPADARRAHAAPAQPARGHGTFRPEVRVVDADRGALQVSFPGGRRRAPGRGRHLLRIALAVPFAEALREARRGPDDLELRFTLPPWEAGLDLPRIVVEAPYPIAPPLDRPRAPGLRVLSRRTPGVPEGYEVAFDRVHLPRETPWPVAVRIPRGTAPPALVASLGGSDEADTAAAGAPASDPEAPGMADALSPGGAAGLAPRQAGRVGLLAASLWVLFAVVGPLRLRAAAPCSKGSNPVAALEAARGRWATALLAVTGLGATVLVALNRIGPPELGLVGLAVAGLPSLLPLPEDRPRRRRHDADPEPPVGADRRGLLSLRQNARGIGRGLALALGLAGSAVIVLAVSSASTAAGGRLAALRAAADERELLASALVLAAAPWLPSLAGPYRRRAASAR